MTLAQDAAVRAGVSIPANRLLGQLGYSLALAEADEPELAAVGWGIFQTESLRRQRLRLERLLGDDGVGTLEEGSAPRIYDVFRRARDLADAVETYALLAFEISPQSWPRSGVVTPLWSLPLLIERIRELEGTVRQHLPELMAEGMPPAMYERLGAEIPSLMSALRHQDAAVRGIGLHQREVAQLKGEIYHNLCRLNRMGQLAYRADHGHAARFNLEILECLKPGFTLGPAAGSLRGLVIRAVAAG